MSIEICPISVFTGHKEALCILWDARIRLPDSQSPRTQSGRRFRFCPWACLAVGETLRGPITPRRRGPSPPPRGHPQEGLKKGPFGLNALAEASPRMPTPRIAQYTLSEHGEKECRVALA